MSEENKEVCPNCGSSSFMGDVNMTPRRYCKCGNTWLPKPKLREENKTVFDLNDRVTAFGIEGVVISVDFAKDYPIKVDFYNGKYPTFTKDGKLYNWHLEPSLKLIEKAKKKVKKKIEAWACIHKDGTYTLCLSKTIAQNSYTSIDIIKLTGEYEVEE